MKLNNMLVVLLVFVLVSSCAQYGQKTIQPPTPAPTQPPQTQIQEKPQPTAPTAPTAPTSQPTTAVKEFSITADDSSYLPSGSINVKKGDKVKITFNVKTSGVKFGGLDFRSSEFDTGTIKPGSSKTVEFVADKSFSISSYWPGSNTKKPYTINVIVQ